MEPWSPAGREYLVHGDETLRDRVDEVAARGRRAVIAWVMTLAMSSEVEPKRPTSPAWVLPNEAPTAALYVA